MNRLCLAKALLLSLVLAGPAVAAEPRDVPSMTVSGAGETTARPDQAHVSVGVTAQRPSAQQALRETSAAMGRVLQALKEFGVAEKDVQTVRIDLHPQYAERPRKDGPPTIVGYQATNQVRITVRLLDSLGAVLDRLVADGGNTLAGIEFGLAEPERVVDAARQRAVADARRKAELYAAGAGVKLARVLEISEQDVGVPRPKMVMMRAEMAAAADVPVAPGELSYRAQVTLRYAIE